MSEQINSKTYTTAQAESSAGEEWTEGPLKAMLIDYVGAQHEPHLGESEEITVEMIVETMANEFPEFLMMIAEENWIRGYQQAIHDVDEGQRLLAEHHDTEAKLTSSVEDD